jgi:fatty acid desaturase
MDEAAASATLLSRAEQKAYARRTDRDGLQYLVLHSTLLLATGGLVVLAGVTWWLLPAMFLHGIVITFLFAPLHETSHGTAFRTRWLNETVFRTLSVLYISPPLVFRYWHACHHTYTHMPGRDPDISLPLPRSLYQYLRYCSAIPFWRRNVTWFVSFALGKPATRDRWFIPRDELPRAYREARIMLAGLAVLVALSIWARSPWLLTLWLLPRLMGEPIMRWVRIAEHVGCEDSGDLTRNTRSTHAPAWFHRLFWNMSYHAEHHLCPAAPFHALPRMHRQVGGQVHPVGSGYLAVHAMILSDISQGQADYRPTAARRAPPPLAGAAPQDALIGD